MGEKEEQVAWHASALALSMTEEARWKCRGCKPDNLHHFCERKRKPYVFHRFFYFSGPPGFTMSFDALERIRRFNRIQCQRSKVSSRGKKKRQVFLCRRTVRVKVKGKVIPTSFLKIKEGGRSLERKTGERGMVSRIGRLSEPRS